MLGLGGDDMLNGGAGNDILVGGAERRTHDGGTIADNFNSRQLTQQQRRAELQRRLGGNRRQRRPARPQARSASTTAAMCCASTATTGIERRRDHHACGQSRQARPRRRSAYDCRRRQPRWRRNCQRQLFAADGDELRQPIHDRSATTPAAANHTAERRRSLRHAAIRFVANGASTTRRERLRSTTARSPFAVGVETLNGGLGDDTYSFTLGDGNDVINEVSRNERRHG